MEKTIETKTCRFCSTKFEITDKDLEFYEKVSPVFNGKKYNIPSPTLCPDCRTQRRLVWRNERSLYKNKCSATGKSIISCYSPDKKYKIFEPNEWWSDKWNPLDFGKDFDSGKTFFDQMDELIKAVPRQSTENLASENSDFNNCVGLVKDCYMLAASGYDEKCLYGNNVERSINCVDTYLIFDCENCYEISTCYNCSYLFYSYNCKNCSFSEYLFDCVGCKNCFGCVGLANKEYFILNKQYSKGEYADEIKKLKSNSDLFFNGLKKLKLSVPKKYIIGYSVEESYGDDLIGTKNAKNCYIMENCEDCKNCSFCRSTKYSMDFDIFGYPGEFCYEDLCVGLNAYMILFSTNCMENTSHLFYSDSCYNCSDCFSCAGLRNKQYCILNKQYTKEEYETLVPKIIEHMIKTGEWGEFFPSSISPFGYNETLASEYFPLLKEQAISKGFKWSTYENPKPNVEKTIPASILPDNIKDVPDDILNWAIECEITNKPFRIIKPELDFYRKHSVPVPRRHPDQRHLDRMKLRNPRKLYDRLCDKCGKDIKTTYNPERPEIVYCENCYLKEVF